MTKIVAICGPDGAGKTTLVRELAKEGYGIFNFGRKGDYVFWSTKFSFKVYYFLRTKKYVLLTKTFLYLIVYPLEYINNLFKFFTAKKFGKEVVFFDRYEIDRMWRAKQGGKQGYLLQRFVDRILFFIYLHFYPRADIYIFLLPEAEVLFNRRREFYKEVANAKKVRGAYLEVSQFLKEKGVEVYVFYDTITYKTILDLL